MTTPINLNKARKKKARADKRVQADANSITFGRSKAEKTLAARENIRVARALDGKALEMPVKDADLGSKKS